MISREEVLALAALARLELVGDETEKLRRDLDSILGYVARLQARSDNLSSASETRALSDNTVRADTRPHPSGAFTERLLTSSPACRGNYFAVKSIFPSDAN